MAVPILEHLVNCQVRGVWGIQLHDHYADTWQEHLRVLHAMFSECGGEMDAAQFTEYFGGLLGITDDEAMVVFLKIDFDNDGEHICCKHAGKQAQYTCNAERHGASV